MRIETRLKGKPLSPGVGRGISCFVSEFVAVPPSVFPVENVENEILRLRQALEWLVELMTALASEAESQLGSELAGVFRAHRMILEDPVVGQQLFDAIRIERQRAETAVQVQMESYRRQLEVLDSEYLKERASDIAEIEQELLHRLGAQAPGLCCKYVACCQIGECQHGSDHILVAPELTPELALEASRHTKGFLVESAERTSHAVILARALNLPVVSGLEHLFDIVPIDADILVDGTGGDVFLNPSEETLRRYRAQADSNTQTHPGVHPVPDFMVMASIMNSAGARDALVAKAEGIGLYRTEVEILAEGRLFTEMEELARYTQVLEAMARRPVYVRLLDLGGDKAARWLELPREGNPALGCRGARLLLSRPELFRAQARALTQAAQHRPIHVIYPMIVDIEQFRRLRGVFDEAATGLDPGYLHHGIMFEVPSACLQAEQLFEEADFGCIGTNDLVQYLFAIDRTATAIDDDELFSKSALWRLIEEVVKAAQATRKPLSVCGELASIPRFVSRLIDAGVNIVSVNPRQINAVRQAAHQYMYGE